ncbi:PadR family transcriptional regulator [Paenibacillus cellulositrophicus]|uniref:PadR family transcriptional regulator n=1 Tax=Paenibacillus cellulositrophicus TaxID=562959 RepID=UPI001266F384|nr:PadR family transcriptional regulator [Paenibacillus cellulositrophicus]
MNVQFKKGVLEMCVLALLARKDYYGFELAERISMEIDIAEGSLYPLLRRLRAQNYLSTYHVESAEGPSRKYYSMTEVGLRHLEGLLAEWGLLTDAINRLIEGEMKREQG